MEGCEYWLIAGTHASSKRGEKAKEGVLLNELSQKLSASTVSVHKFSIPELKVGTLDDLVALSDKMNKQNQVVEGVVRKCATTLHTLLIDHSGKLSEALTVDGQSVDATVNNFHWHTRKYFLKNSTTELAQELMNTIQAIDQELKNRMQSYQQLKSSLNQIERNQTGNLLSRNLVDIVKREHVVADSEYLTTLFAAIPNANEQEWLGSYATLTDMVVPNSSKKIVGEDDYCLYSVTLFKRVAEEFKHQAREYKFMVRDFTYDPDALHSSQQVKEDLNAKITKTWASLVRWTKFQFSDAVVCLLHLKALNVFVEGVLRYGLPPTFETFVIVPKNRNEKRVRESLSQVFGHLESLGSRKNKEDDDTVDIAGVSNEYYPYVSFSLNTEFLGGSKR